MLKIINRIFPAVDSFKKSWLPFLNFRFKVYLALAILIFGIYVLIGNTFREYSKLQTGIVTIRQVSPQLDTVKTLRDQAMIVLNKAIDAVKNQTTINPGENVINLNKMVVQLKSGVAKLKIKTLADSMKNVTAMNIEYIKALNYYNIYEIDKVHYFQELKPSYLNFYKALGNLENELGSIQPKQLWSPWGMIIFCGSELLLLAVLVLVSGWIIIMAIKTVTEPAMIISRRFRKDPTEEGSSYFSVLSKEGLGASAFNLKEGEAVWGEIFTELKDLVKKLDEQCRDLIAGVKVQEISEIQIFEAHKEINSYVEEQMKTTEKANQEVTFLVSNLFALQKIPYQLKAFAEKIQGLLTAMDTNLTAAINTPLDFKDSSYIIRALFEDLGFTAAKINAVVAVLNEVSEQAELLAFNTAIQAARAGSQGLGFGVVSREIAKLVDRSKKSAANLDSSIVQVQNEIKTVNDILPQAIINAETVAAFQRAVSDICAKTIETTRSSVDYLLHSILVFENIIAKSSEITREANLISKLDFDEKEALNKMEVEILDYQLNLKEAIRIAGKVGESVQGLKRTSAKIDRQAPVRDEVKNNQSP
jgi:methyl-accepting chemotaxis protein